MSFRPSSIGRSGEVGQHHRPEWKERLCHRPFPADGGAPHRLDTSRNDGIRLGRNYPMHRLAGSESIHQGGKARRIGSDGYAERNGTLRQILCCFPSVHGTTEGEEIPETGALTTSFQSDGRTILSAGNLREGLQRLSAHDDLSMPYSCYGHMAGKYTGNYPKRKYTTLENRSIGRHTAHRERSGAYRMERQEQGRAGHCSGICAENHQEARTEDDRKRSLHCPCRTVGSPQDGLPFPTERNWFFGKLAERVASDTGRVRTSQGRSLSVHH